MEKGFGRPLSSIGGSHSKGILDDGEGERDWVLLELIWVCVLDVEERVWPWGVFWMMGIGKEKENERNRKSEFSFFVLLSFMYYQVLGKKKTEFFFLNNFDV